MKCVTFCLIWAGLMVGYAIAEEKTDFKGPKDEASYSIGFQMGTDFQKRGLAVDPEMIAAGMRDALGGAEPKLSNTDMNARLSEVQAQMMQARQEEIKELAARNLAEGNAFLAENAKREGVVSLPSGLQYQVLKEGEGKSPSRTDSVTVHYRGTLIDGKEFDSSYSRGKPATFPLDRVIRGWTEGVQLMKPGAGWKLFIPPNLAYGEKGGGSRIPPNSTLIFELELISFEAGKSE